MHRNANTVYAHMYACVHVCTFVWTYVYANVCVLYLHICTYTYVCVYAFVHNYVECAYIRMYMHICMHVCTYVHSYEHVYMQKHKHLHAWICIEQTYRILAYYTVNKTYYICKVGTCGTATGDTATAVGRRSRGRLLCICIYTS